MTYAIKLTQYGLTALASAEMGGPVISLTQIAVGDGNGNPVTPSDTATALVREVHRTPINALFKNPNDATIVMAEMVIPSDIGGWAIREVGLFDATGALFAYGNFPETYKPIAAEGSTREMVIHVATKVGNAENVQLVIDTSIVLATRPWVLSTITAAFLIPGGLTGQVLTKASNAAGDFTWKDPTDAVNIAVDVIKEVQTAVADQQVFTLTVCTTEGVAVYVEGGREYDITPLNATQVQLSRPLSAGTRVLFVQNEPNEPLKLRRTITGRGYFLGQL
jgi:phage-related tail fiber protein